MQADISIFGQATCMRVCRLLKDRSTAFNRASCFASSGRFSLPEKTLHGTLSNQSLPRPAIMAMAHVLTSCYPRSLAQPQKTAFEVNTSCLIRPSSTNRLIHSSVWPICTSISRGHLRTSQTIHRHTFHTPSLIVAQGISSQSSAGEAVSVGNNGAAATQGLKEAADATGSSGYGAQQIQVRSEPPRNELASSLSKCRHLILATAIPSLS